MIDMQQNNILTKQKEKWCMNITITGDTIALNCNYKQIYLSYEIKSR